jgi:membrane fusion protein, macrolide-specific efflux system
MKKNLVIIGVIFSVLLSSCGNNTTTDTPAGSGTTQKTPFVVKTMKINTWSGIVFVEKTGRITASSSLTLTSQWAGEIWKILVKEWQKVKAGTTIAVLKDTVNNFDLRLSQAENTLKVQETSIDTTKINLEQSVENARIAYERAKKTLETLTAKNGILEATLMNTNQKTLDTYNINYKSYLLDIEKNMTQMLYEGDKILGITTNFEYANDAWEPYLGTRVWNSKALALNDWNRTWAMRGDIRAKIEKWTDLDFTNPIKDLELVATWIAQTRTYADSMLFMIQNNVIGAGLSQELQTGWLASWNGLRSQIGWSETAFNAWKAGALSFLKSYKNNELWTRLAVASLSRELTAEENTSLAANAEAKLTFDTTKINLKDQIDNAKLSLEQTQESYKNTLALQEATIAQLDATKRNAEIALDQARRDYSKLSISAPIDGNITKVIANVGQTVNVWSAIAEFSGKLPQITIDLDTELASTLMPWDTVIVETEKAMMLTGVISAVSNVSNANLLSTVRMSIQNGEKYIGQTVNITFTSRGSEWVNNAFLLPINAVKIISEEEGEVYTLSETWSLLKKTVKLGKVWDTNIEIIWSFKPKESLITSDMSNYDEVKNIIQAQ